MFSVMLVLSFYRLSATSCKGRIDGHPYTLVYPFEDFGPLFNKAIEMAAALSVFEICLYAMVSWCCASTTNIVIINSSRSSSVRT